MLVTQKCQYALKAIFILAKRGGDRPIKIAHIAEEQTIPFRFLEVILSQLKQGGFVESRRGTEGGYLLAQRPEEVRVGDIVRFIDGSNFAEENAGALKDGAHPGVCEDLFTPIWRRARQAIFDVFDGITIADLVQQYEDQHTHATPNFII